MASKNRMLDRTGKTEMKMDRKPAPHTHRPCLPLLSMGSEIPQVQDGPADVWKPCLIVFGAVVVDGEGNLSRLSQDHCHTTPVSFPHSKLMQSHHWS